MLHVTYRGPIRVEDVDSLAAVWREVAAERPVFVASYLAGSTIDREAREHFSRSLRAEWFHGLIYVGADPLQRAITKAIVIGLYFDSHWRVDVEFVRTEQEAQRVIARLRRVRGVELGASQEPASTAMALGAPSAAEA